MRTGTWFGPWVYDGCAAGASATLMGAPSPPTPKQLRELHIRVVAPEK